MEYFCPAASPLFDNTFIPFAFVAFLTALATVIIACIISVPVVASNSKISCTGFFGITSVCLCVRIDV